VAVIAAIGGDVSALAAKHATSTIPILFINGLDPVKAGLVASLNQPGGNATGVYLFVLTVEPKKLELLCQLVPQAASVGLLVNPNSPQAEAVRKDVEAAAQTLGRQIKLAAASTEPDIDTAFAGLVERGVGAVLVSFDPIFFGQREQLVALAARHAMPAIYEWRDFALAGGPMSYGTDLADSYRLMGVYTGRILKGEKPADLPVQQPTKFEFIINLNTAKLLGLVVPPTLLAIANEVIE